MNRLLKSGIASGLLAVSSIGFAYQFEVLEESYLQGGSIIKLVEYGAEDKVGVWLMESEDLVLIDADTGNYVARCDRTVDANEVFGEYGGNAVNIDGYRVQYSGVEGNSLAGWAMNCFTGEVERIGNYIPTYTDPDGRYTVGYDGSNTNIYYADGSSAILHPLVDRIFYYSGDANGDLLAGYQSTDDGNILPYVNTMGQVSSTRGLAVVRETPFGDTVISGRALNENTIVQDYITPSAEDSGWKQVNRAFVMADANPDGFIFNRYSIGAGQYGGEDIIGNDCVITDDPTDIESDIDPAELTIVDKWCQSFIRQGTVVYVATGDSWQNSYKVMKLQLQAAEQVFTTSTNNCLDSPPIGDGWGWDGNYSCRIESANVVASDTCFDSPPLGDGWGWNGVDSCRIDPGENAASVAYTGECFDAPPLNNGWGWDGQNSCELTTSATSAVVLVSGDCVESAPTGGGWGWDGENSCEVNENNATGTMVVPADNLCIDTPPLNDGRGWDGENGCTISAAVIAIDGVCIDTAPIGDGFGWDGFDSCRIQTGETLTSDGACVDTAPFGDGWGWDGTQSCRIEGILLDADENGCVDSAPLGDGWGWDGTQSCQIQY